MTPYDDIRPYDDSEVVPVIRNLLSNPEFIGTMAGYMLPGLRRWLPGIATRLVRKRLGRQLGGLTRVDQFQGVVADYLGRIIQRTTAGLSISGLDHMDPQRPSLIVSTHRDIVMDPAVINYVLRRNGIETARIAIGDNLVQKPFVSDILRLNKCFLVRRSAMGVRDKLVVYQTISSYIHHSLEEGVSVWIAQREGRSKDGSDETQPAIIKMLYLSRKKTGIPFSECINRLNILPVAISYEYNPCDSLLARELFQRRREGDYKKAPEEDLRSIAVGLTGYKGHVHVDFGHPLSGRFQTPESVAREIDGQIAKLYYLHPSNYIAAEKIGAPPGNGPAPSKEKRAEFERRMMRCEAEIREVFLEIYANPVKKKPGGPA